MPGNQATGLGKTGSGRGSMEAGSHFGRATLGHRRTGRTSPTGRGSSCPVTGCPQRLRQGLPHHLRQRRPSRPIPRLVRARTDERILVVVAVGGRVVANRFNRRRSMRHTPMCRNPSSPLQHRRQWRGSPQSAGRRSFGTRAPTSAAARDHLGLSHGTIAAGASDRPRFLAILSSQVFPDVYADLQRKPRLASRNVPK